MLQSIIYKGSLFVFLLLVFTTNIYRVDQPFDNTTPQDDSFSLQVSKERSAFQLSPPSQTMAHYEVSSPRCKLKATLGKCDKCGLKWKGRGPSKQMAFVNAPSAPVSRKPSSTQLDQLSGQTPQETPADQHTLGSEGKGNGKAQQEAGGSAKPETTDLQQSTASDTESRNRWKIFGKRLAVLDAYASRLTPLREPGR